MSTISDETRERALNTFKKCIKNDWIDLITINDFHMSTFSQGNYICDFKVDGRVIKQLVIRFYDENPGKNTVLTISEEAETIVAFMLHSTHMAPKVHTVFKNGRIEEFVPCWALHAESLYEQDILLEVARTMARLHSMRDVPVARNRSFLNDKFQTFRSLIATRNDMTFDEYSDWLSNQNRKQFGIDFNLENEMVEVETSLRNSPQELVFCHNDLFVYNILYRETATQASKMILTNFDLCGYNYPAYDFAHLFNSVYLEHAGYPLEEILPFNAEPFNQLRHRLLTLYYEEMRKINPSTASSNAATNSGRHLNESVINNQEVIRFQSYSTLLGILLILATQFHANETLPDYFNFRVHLYFSQKFYREA